MSNIVQTKILSENDINTFNWETGAWNILKLMMREPNFLIQHQIGPFNEFLDKGLKNVIEQFNPIILNYDFVTKQQFYRFKDDSKFAQKPNNWVEFIELADIYKIFKDKYSLINTQITTVDLSEALGGSNDKEKLIQTEFKEFVEKHIEFNTIEVNKHRYDLEIEIYFNSITPPTIFENNGSQKIMYPNEARLRNFTYASNIYVNVVYRVRERCGEGLNDLKETANKTIQKVNLGKMPIMLGSKACILSSKNFNHKMDYEECEFDEGGYFIVNGTEKVIIGQERQAENKVYVFRNSKSQSKYSYFAEVKSLPDKKIVTPKNIQVKITSKETIHGKNIKVSIPHIKQDVPLFVVFKALGVINDYDITNFIIHDIPEADWGEYTQFLRSSLEEASTINTQQLAKEYLCKYVNMMGYDRDKSERDKRMTYLNDIIKNDFIPHVGEDYRAKAYYLGYMVKRLLDVFLKKKNCDDRDSYVNKRIDTTGILMANLFRQYYTKLIKDMKTNINKEYTSGSWKSNKNFENIINQTNIYKIIKYSTITTGIKFALATGNWGLKNNKNKQGIAQVLSRLTYNSTLSHLRRINTPMEKSSKIVAPRKLHGTQMMYICGAETPEGGSVGVVKNLALSCHITNYSDIQSVINMVSGMEVKSILEVDPTELFGFAKIFINGNWIFSTNKPKKIVEKLVTLRRQGIIHIHCSIVWKIDDNIIEIHTDAGRCTRPLYIVKNNKFVINDAIIYKIDKGQLKWNNLIVGSLNESTTFQQKLIDEGVIEFIDVQEENNCMIAVNQDRLNENGTKAINYKYTHAEIHPSFLQGVLASIIPFSDHNQSPRNTYQCLSTEETVLMADGTKKKIKDVVIGDEVITFDLKTTKTSITKVIHQYVRPTDKKIYKLTTVSGREIIATGNHNFMTTDGWKAVENMDENTKIGIFIDLNKEKIIKKHIIDEFNKINNESYTLGEWLETVVVKDESIFVPVLKIEEVENQLISDITVESDNHSFIAGDNFLSSNSAMGKQAMGIYATNFRYRMDTVAHILRYPQLPLVNSRVIKYLPSNDLPSGINAIVAIASFSGYNQEDSVIINKSSVERGLFVSDHYHTYKDEEKKRQSSSVKMQEKFIKPNPKNTLGTRGNNYSKINDNGLPEENIKVKENDVIIGKTYPIHSKKDDKELYRCCSTTIKASEEGYVDKVIVSRNGDGYKFVKVRIRTSRYPEIGDKVASRHGQKGTCGMQYRQEDMPFTKRGMVPDIIMNPHAVPSRMTIAQVIECLMGKTGVHLGMFGDATAFTKVDVNKLGDLLEKLGFQRHCDEILYNGRTGEQLKVPIFIGPTYYQRLKHMVSDKMHCYTADHEVLTKNRDWISITDVKLDDTIVSMNPNTLEITYENPTEIQSFDYNGHIYEIKDENVELSITSNHRMFIHNCVSNKYDFVEMEKVYELSNFSMVTGMNINKKQITILNNNVQKIDYSDKVYCCTVPSGLLYIRKNNKEVWCGNSRASGPNVIMTRQPVEGRSQAGGLRFG